MKIAFEFLLIMYSSIDSNRQMIRIRFDIADIGDFIYYMVTPLVTTYLHNKFFLEHEICFF